MAEVEKLLPEKIKAKQYLVACIAILISLGLVSAWVLFGNKKKSQIPIDLDKATKIEISKITGGVKAEDRWLQQAEGQLQSLQKQIETQKIEKKALDKQIKELHEEFNKQSVEREENVPQELTKLKEEIEMLKSLGRRESQQEQIQGLKKIRNTEIKLNVDSKKEFDLENYIPSGSYASAVIISGVDASVGVNSQSDPRPTLFRITGKAKSAVNNGNIQEADLIGCTVTGAASGDLSSERVFIRLLKMICSREDGKVYETSVQGYVVGIGKAGIRGEVVSREGDFVMKSFLAGVASGLGSGAAQSFTSPMSFSGGGFFTAQRPEAKDILGKGVGKGLETSSNKVSNYLIQRAEQYQPVISIPSGLAVELVFSEGFYINQTDRINGQNSN